MDGDSGESRDEDGKPVDIEMIMTGAITRGLALKDFEEMTIGQIVDYCITYNDFSKSKDEPEEKIRIASQRDFDRF